MYFCPHKTYPLFLMMYPHMHRLFFLLVCSFLWMCSTSTAHAKVNAAQSEGFLTTEYLRPHAGISLPDTIYIFPATLAPHASISLTSEWPSAFQWYRLSPETSAIGLPFYESTANANESRIDTLSEGGYLICSQAFTTDTTYTDTTIVWILFNQEFAFKMETDAHLQILRGQSCANTHFYLDPDCPIHPVTFPYFHPFSLESYTATIPISFTVKAGNNSTVPCYLQQDENQEQYISSSHLFAVATRYTFTATDYVSHSHSAEVICPPYITQSAFTIQPVTDANGKYSAPLLVQFNNESVNANHFIWRFGDDEEEETQMLTHPEHTYSTPKTYTITLWAQNENLCESESQQSVTVDPSALNNANVFTPNGDGQNDVFLPYNVSIRSFSIQIFSRNGRLVYRHEGSDMRNWAGWDGKTAEGNDASTGVYYYVMKAKGYGRKQTYDGKEYTGFIYLYR